MEVKITDRIHLLRTKFTWLAYVTLTLGETNLIILNV